MHVWEADAFTLNDRFFGFVLRDEEGVYSYECSARALLQPLKRLDGHSMLVPCFSRFEHAALFAAHLPSLEPGERPTVVRGLSYDLTSLREASSTTEPAPDAVYAWGFVLAVLDATEAGDDLDFPADGLPGGDQVRLGLSRFVRVIDWLDHSLDDDALDDDADG